MPRPPRTQPTIARANSTSAFDMPQRSITVPAKMNDGHRQQNPILRAGYQAGGKHLQRKAAEHEAKNGRDAEREYDW